jgi:hypothetical protein
VQPLRHVTFVAAYAGLFLGAFSAPGLAAADPEHPDWPCVQKRVENLSVAAIWDGPPIDEHKEWYRDKAIADLVPKLAARRVPLEKAIAAIAKFGKDLPPQERDVQLTKLFAGLFNTVNTQRRAIITGIEKFQRAQKARAEELEKQGVNIAELKGNIVVDDTGATPLTPEEEKAYWAGRIFQERQANIPIACELPPIIEERLFELSRTIRAQMSK